MLRYMARRLISLIPLLIVITALDFMLLSQLPGDTIEIMFAFQSGTTQEELDRARHELGLDRPLVVQYVDWMGRVLKGDLGTSIRTGRSIAEELASRLPVTLELTFGAMTVAIILGVSVGFISAVKRNSFIDMVLRVLSLFGLSMPSFWLGTLLIIGVSLWLPRFFKLGYTPPGEGLWSNLHSLILPAISLGIPMSALIARMLRSSVLEVLGQDYVRTARGKGLKERRVMAVHVMKNAAIPVVTVIGLQAGQLLGGAILIEQIFLYPGLGQVTVQAIGQREYQMLQGVVLLVAALVLTVNLLTDLVYAYIDPRIKYQ